MIARLATALAVMLTASAAQAERLVVSLSNARIAVTSNYVGENLVLFGTVQPDTGGHLQSDYALVVTASEPPETLRTRRKARVLGIFVNVDSREFVRVPSYLTIITDRPIAYDFAINSAVADEESLKRYIGHPDHQAAAGLWREFATWVIADYPF